jgi:Tfp pilus assembly protein PilO
MNSKSRKLQIALSIICFVVSIAVYLFVRYDINSSIESVQFEQSNLKKSSVYDIATQENLTRIYNDTKQGREYLYSMVPTTDDSVKLVEYIEGLSKQSSTTVSIGELNTSDIDDGTKYKILTTHLSVKGKWENVLNFIHKVESTPNLIIRVDNMSVSLLGNVTIGKNRYSEWGAQFDVKIIIKNNEQ